MMELEDKPDLTISKKGEILFIQVEDVFPFIENLPGGRSIECAKDMKEGGFPNAGGSDNGCLLPLRKSKIHSFENLHTFGSISVRLEKLLDLDQLFQTIASLAFSTASWESSSFIWTRRFEEISFRMGWSLGNLRKQASISSLVNSNNSEG